MKSLFLSIALVTHVGFLSASDRDSVLQFHIDTLKMETTDFGTLFSAITKVAITDEEKLTAFYYWVFKHISFDTERFNKDATALSLKDVLINKKGLCKEYTLLVHEACKQLKIPNVKIEGYVKYYGFAPGRKFKEVNHVWNAVYLGKSWQLIDMLWACGALKQSGNTYTFNKKIIGSFFLSEPGKFIDTHIPDDPIWQFKYYPYKMEAFINSPTGIDTSVARLSYVNYRDSIQEFLKLSESNQLIKTGERSYNYNPDNCITFSMNHYNVAVDIINNKTSTQAQLMLAKRYLTSAQKLCQNSTDLNILELANLCSVGITTVERKLVRMKN